MIGWRSDESCGIPWHAHQKFEDQSPLVGLPSSSHGQKCHDVQMPVIAVAHVRSVGFWGKIRRHKRLARERRSGSIHSSIILKQQGNKTWAFGRTVTRKTVGYGGIWWLIFIEVWTSIGSIDPVVFALTFQSEQDCHLLGIFIDSCLFLGQSHFARQLDPAQRPPLFQLQRTCQCVQWRDKSLGPLKTENKKKSGSQWIRGRLPCATWFFVEMMWTPQVWPFVYLWVSSPKYLFHCFWRFCSLLVKKIIWSMIPAHVAIFSTPRPPTPQLPLGQNKKPWCRGSHGPIKLPLRNVSFSQLRGSSYRWGQLHCQ